MDIRAFIEHLKTQPGYRDQIVHVEHLPARRAWYGKLDHPLAGPVRDAMRAAGVEQLYTHQVQAINAIRAGQNVIVSTGTASGKTLVYNLPVCEAVVEDWRARALYLFPTKALARDQLRSLEELARPHLEGVRFGVYDGDTPRQARGRMRREAAIILTNPDMLHLGILPNHNLWSSFFRGLAFVVVDEAHYYRGILGSQVACVLRRLRRVCRAYGSEPQFILCSATIANPGEHAARLTGLPAKVVDEDGAPQGAREFVLWNPPFVDEARSARRSANYEAAALLAEMVRQAVRNITFTRARRVAELILVYARRALEEDAPELAARIKSYRAGYLPQQRRQIERALFAGELLGVTATSALELGIDVGSLDATALVGYPGTIASLWQRAGRAGRGQREALSVLIGLDNPLDQYFMRHPGELFGRPHEHALIDPGNPYVMEMHLPCAAYELPLEARDEELFGKGFEDAMLRLEESRALEYRNGRWFSVGAEYPAQEVSLRAIAGSRVALVREDSGELLEEISATSAPFRVHPGAIYLHQGETYRVASLDLELGEAILHPVEVSYYTQPRELNDVRIIRSLRHRRFSAGHAYFGFVRVTQQVVGYTRRQQFGESILEMEDLDLPEQSYETAALWFDVPSTLAVDLATAGRDFHGGLHAAEHAAIGILPLFAMCDRLDIGGLSTPRHPDTDRPQIFIYDAYPGGVGIAEKGFELLPELWAATLDAIEECPCEEGCPACVQSPRCGNNNEPLDKQAAATILRTLLGG